MSYNPIPARVWSRVQNPCTFIVPGSTYTQAYIPLTDQTVSQAQANYEEKLIYKGNILQYKGNSSRLTKSQKYTQLAKGFGPARKKAYATQSQTYTNPNTTGLQRVNYETYPYPNSIVGAPNNSSGPFQYNVRNPNGCLDNSIQDGGSLVCGTYINPCTGEIVKQGVYSAIICNPASASDVPGSSILCWNNKLEPWFPKPRYVMNNSTDKWPDNYKGFVSALKPPTPVLTLVSSIDDSSTFSWTVTNDDCIPISSYNIYVNGQLYTNVPYTTTTITINPLYCANFFYLTSVSNTTESLPSNTVTTNNIKFSITGGGSFVNTSGTYTATFISSGTITFYCSVGELDVIIVGGGGGGSPGSTNSSDNKGGGGGGGAEVYSFSTSDYTFGTSNNIVVGVGGNGGNPGQTNTSSGTPTTLAVNTTCTADAGLGANGQPGGRGGGLVYGGDRGEPGQDGTVNNGEYGGGGGGDGDDISNSANGGGGGGVAYDFTTNTFISGGTGGKGGINGTTSGAGSGGQYNGGNGSAKGISGANGTYGGGGGGGGGTTGTIDNTGNGGNGGNGFCIISFSYP